MADAAIFIGWGPAVVGREQKALQVFGEGVEFWTRMQQAGEIESFEAFQLEPHGGDLAGFCILRGEAERLARLRGSAEFLRLNQRAALVVTNFGVVNAVSDGELQRQFAEFGQFAAELA